MSTPRIIAGTAKGFRLKDVPGDTTRPITDRVKENLFNILGTDVNDSTWLDLFGGTGSVGIEALSRGAQFVRFIDINRQAVEAIQYNLSHSHLTSKAQVIRADAFSQIKQPVDREFDFVYIAPPQYKSLWVRAVEELSNNSGWLAPDGWMIVQIDPVEYQDQQFPLFNLVDQRKYGSTLLLFYEKKAE